MIYTIGDPVIYDEYLDNDGNPMKMGRKYGYTGGSVWLTIDEAQAHAIGSVIRSTV